METTQQPRTRLINLELFDNGDGSLDLWINDEICGTWTDILTAVMVAKGELSERLDALFSITYGPEPEWDGVCRCGSDSDNPCVCN